MLVYMGEECCNYKWKYDYFVFIYLLFIFNRYGIVEGNIHFMCITWSLFIDILSIQISVLSMNTYTQNCK